MHRVKVASGDYTAELATSAGGLCAIGVESYMPSLHIGGYIPVDPSSSSLSNALAPPPDRPRLRVRTASATVPDVQVKSESDAPASVPIETSSPGRTPSPPSPTSLPSESPATPPEELSDELQSSEPEETTWALIPYDVPWGDDFVDYQAGKLPGPEGNCLFLRSPTPVEKRRAAQACQLCRERKAKVCVPHFHPAFLVLQTLHTSRTQLSFLGVYLHGHGQLTFSLFGHSVPASAPARAASRRVCTASTRPSRAGRQSAAGIASYNHAGGQLRAQRVPPLRRWRCIHTPHARQGDHASLRCAQLRSSRPRASLSIQCTLVRYGAPWQAPHPQWRLSWRVPGTPLTPPIRTSTRTSPQHAPQVHSTADHTPSQRRSRTATRAVTQRRCASTL